MARLTITSLRLRIVGQAVEVVCDEPDVAMALEVNYGALLADGAEAVELRYRASNQTSPPGFLLHLPDGHAVHASDLADLVFQLEKAIIVALQERRPEILFLHAAALERDGSAWLLVGESGAGKSTTAWGLLQDGFGYLSDELAPIDLATLEVLPYRHALCLKRRPPPPFALPPECLDLGSTIHVPARSLPGPSRADACVLGAVFFLSAGARLTEPVVRPVGAAEAAARLYVSTLNALAHQSRGLDAVLRVARAAKCFIVEAGDLERTCRLIAATTP